MRFNLKRVLALFVVVGISASAWAAPWSIEYGDIPAEDSNEVTFVGLLEQSDNAMEPTDPSDGQFGEPTKLTPGEYVTSLKFFPLRFSSTSSNGEAETIDGQLQTEIIGAENRYIDQIAFSEAGDFSLVGGALDTNANIFAAAHVTILEGADKDIGKTVTVVLEVEPEAPYDSPDANAFVADGVIELTAEGLNATRVQVSWDNILQTTSEESSTAMIEKKVLELDVTSQTIIPEPTTALMLLSVGGILALRRRRK
ncbi:MAG: PEP-CTERM sorting domain-containing protein [Phycisphaerae bacterium]